MEVQLIIDKLQTMKTFRSFFLLGAILFSVSAFATDSNVAHTILDLNTNYRGQIKTSCVKLKNDLNGEEGRVWTSFTVLPDGEIRNIRIESSTNAMLDTKAMGVIASLRKMNMAFIKDSIRMLLPIDLYEKGDFYTRNNLCYPIMRKLEAPYPAGEFQGGNDAFANYLYNNFKRSALRVIKSERYYINIDFRIDKNGKATDIKILGNVRLPELRSEVKRLMQNMPAWTNADLLTPENNRYKAKIALGPDDKDLKQVMLNSNYENYYEYIPAEYPGGLNALLVFLMSEIKYPKEAQQKGIYGKVISRVMIDKEGRITDMKIKDGIHPLLDQEALRVISKLPRFKPATFNGVPINMTMLVPLNFQLPAPK